MTIFANSTSLSTLVPSRSQTNFTSYPWDTKKYNSLLFGLLNSTCMGLVAFGRGERIEAPSEFVIQVVFHGPYRFA